MQTWAFPLSLVVAAGALSASGYVRCRGIKHKYAQRLAWKSCVFLAGMALWIALFVAMLGDIDKATERPLVVLAFFVVLLYIGIELRAPYGYSGALENIDGTAEMFFERGTQVTTVAFALGTLLVSQKDANLARQVAPIVFLALFFAVAPALAVGQTARRNLATNPVMGGVQRLSLSFAAGLLCISLALCMDHLHQARWTFQLD